MRVAINGFGRIGRLVARLLMERGACGLELVAVNDLVPAANLAYLLKYDSVHRRPSIEIAAVEGALLLNGSRIEVLAEKEPARLPWRELGVDYVVESTGRFARAEEARGHLEAGARRVVISAPVEERSVPTIVMGVNEGSYCPQEHFLLSNASCTTNCLAPLVKILLDHFGVEEGLMTTVHALTATQPTVDGPSKRDWRGGRAASVNIIPATTGAAKTVGRCLPQVEGKLTGMALRIPTIDVSVVDLTVRLERETSYEALCGAVREAAEGPMKGIVHFCSEELVSSDFIGSPYSCIFDQGAGIALNGRFYKLIAWYDNEMGYAHRVVDLLHYMACREP